MGTGFLQVGIFEEKTGRPVKGALVTVWGGEVALCRESDANGRVRRIALPCPDRRYSMEPQRRVRPYARYGVQAEKARWRGVRVKGVQIFDGRTTMQNILMKPGPSAEFEVFEIPESHLWAD
ncbi:MAG: hypothetical protein FWE85_01895 [Clostridiales bacterium]|nr:hypothetical protein [Clostridiales bacterium]